jgi:2'-5' RNA ligase
MIEQAGRAGKDAVRIFFAIWPDDATRELLRPVANSLQNDFRCAGRRIKAEDIHLTLVFVGNVDNRGLEALYNAADGIGKGDTRPFELAIQQIGYWKHSRIAYVAPREIPSALEELVSLLRQAIECAGFSLEQRAYRPHITLIRDAACRALPGSMEPVIWRVREWLLVKSEQTREGAVYSPVGRWMLGTPE